MWQVALGRHSIGSRENGRDERAARIERFRAKSHSGVGGPSKQDRIAGCTLRRDEGPFWLPMTVQASRQETQSPRHPRKCWMTMGTLLRGTVGFITGVVAAAGSVIVLGLVLPRPGGPPDQLAGHFMGLMYCVFPVVALIFGVLGAFVAARRGQ